MAHQFTTKGMYQIPYSEFITGYDEQYVDGASESTRILFCDWNNRWYFARDLCGQALIANNQLYRWLPEKHPEWNNMDGDEQNTMWCVSAEMIKGEDMGSAYYDPATGAPLYIDVIPGTSVTDRSSIVQTTDSNAVSAVARWGFAYFKTTWKLLDYPLLADPSDPPPSDWTEFNRFTEKKPPQYGGQNLPLPGGTFKFTDDATIPVPEGVPKFFPEDTLFYVWHGVPAVGFDLPANIRKNIDLCRGKVNSKTFDGYAPGELLFLNPIVQRYRSAGQLLCFNLTYAMLVRVNDGIGHNGFFRVRPKAGNPRFLEISTDGTIYPYPAPDGKHVYNDADLLKLWSLS